MGILGNLFTGDNIYRLGAALKDIGDGGSENLSAADKMLAGRAAQQRKAQGLAQLQQILAGQTQPLNANNPSVTDMVTGQLAGDENAPTLAQVTARPMPKMPSLRDGKTISQLLALSQDNPDGVDFAMKALKAAEPDPDRIVEGPDGIYNISGGKASKIQDYPERPNTTPGQVNPQTGRWEWAPGYLESQASLAGVRRDAIVSRPTPSRARAPHSAGGGARTSPATRTYDPASIKWGE
jgi:hypothetical protein